MLLAYYPNQLSSTHDQELERFLNKYLTKPSFRQQTYPKLNQYAYPSKFIKTSSWTRAHNHSPQQKNYSHMFMKYINNVKNGNISTKNNKSRVKKFSRDDDQQLLGDSKYR